MREQLYACEPNFLLSYLEKLENASDEEIKLAAETFRAELDHDPVDDIYEEDGDEVRIAIDGLLSMDGPPPIARLFGFGGTGYRAITAACKRARERKPKTVTLAINSPGGLVTGCDQAWQAIRALSREVNVTAENNGLMASAAYWLASAAPRIVATSPACEQGSIGVKVVAIDDSGLRDAIGIKRISIVSKHAPNKIDEDDAATKHGRSVLQDQCDAMERQFISRIAEGRKITMAKVIADFGQGGILTAEDPEGNPDALSAGMIDAIVAPHEIAAHTESFGRMATGQLAAQSPERSKIMTLKELLAANPAVQAEYDAALKAQYDSGKAQAEARITAAQPFLALAVTKDGYTAAEVEQIRKCAVDVIAGKEDSGALRGFVRMVDMQVESRKSAAAAAETNAHGETPPQDHPVDAAALRARATALKIDVSAVEASAKANKLDPVKALQAEVEMVEQAARDASQGGM